LNYNTYPFILLFLPACLAAFYCAAPRYRLFVLLTSSLIFYGVSGLLPLSVLVSAILWGFFASWFLRGSRSARWLVAAAISVPLLELFIGKYFSFTMGTFGIATSRAGWLGFVSSIVLPAGISFYTFQIVSYLIDVYDGKIERENSFLRLATFISFFPQLIAGPIIRYDQIREQLIRISAAKTLNPNIALGLKYLSFGLFYKIFFADILAEYQISYATIGNFFDAIYSIFSYSVIIYFDFWGYSLIALGLGKLFAIDLPRNFLEPYQSRSPREFWRRWHITLSYWIRDYVYLRLGGNSRYSRNIIIIFVIVGLWHGAGWNFVAWGGYHALLVVGYHLNRRWWDNMPNALQIALTFIAVSIGWPLFYLDAPSYLSLMTTIATFSTSDALSYGFDAWIYLVVVFAYIFLAREDRIIFNQQRGWSDNVMVHGAMTGCALLFFSFGKTFIYFQF
jgi:alginate O-acetyltransferase complex protein AlgI